MKYGSVELKPLAGSITITKKKAQIVRHYPGTDISHVTSLGRQATIITCTLMAFSDDERMLMEQILHSDSSENLEMHNFYFKNVVTGETAQPKPMTPDNLTWYIEAEFIALDPIPYDLTTGEALY